MKVQAIKQEMGFFIPMNNVLKTISDEKIWLEVEILPSAQEDDY